MKKWPVTVWFATVLWTGENAQINQRYSLLPGKSVLNAIPEILGLTVADSTATGTTNLPLPSQELLSLESDQMPDSGSALADASHPVQYAGLPRGLTVYPQPLKDSDHELMFNVSWLPELDPPPKDYSLEVRSLTDTVDCRTQMCYEYNIPGDVQWWTIPAYPSPVADMCAVRPGCAYRVRLIAHPWDGHTAANLHVELDECVSGVCSCAHSPRLPAPLVDAHTVSIQGELFVNITWTLPFPKYPQRLPPGLNKQSYVVRNTM